MITAVKAKPAKGRVTPFSSIKSLRVDPALLPRDRVTKRNHQEDFAARFKKSDDSGCKPERLRLSLDNSSKVRGWKRELDLCCILIALPLILPLLILIVLWIRLVSRGPALFRQERIGQNGKPFILYKFRSMKINSETGRHETYLRHLVKTDCPMIKLDLLCDSRLITGGCLLRAAGLDELPQLLNVLRGEMSLVGPRPCLPQEYRYFSTSQKERFQALPGLTGSWQVWGKNRATFSEMNSMDIHYVRHSSLIMDLRIMMRTPSTLLIQLGEALKQPCATNRNPRIEQGRRGVARECVSQRLG